MTLFTVLINHYDGMFFLLVASTCGTGNLPEPAANGGERTGGDGMIAAASESGMHGPGIRGIFVVHAHLETFET